MRLRYTAHRGRHGSLLLSFARANDLFGTLLTHEWPASRVVNHKAIAVSPESDMDSANANPDGDIRMVCMARHGSRMTVGIQVRRKVSRKTGFHVSIHAGGAGPGERVIAQYDWRGSNASGQLVQNGFLRPIPAGDLRVLQDGDQAPWKPRGRFLMTRASSWSAPGRTAGAPLMKQRR